MRINHWRQAPAADQQQKTPEAEPARELDPEEMTKVSGGISVAPVGQQADPAGLIPAVPGTD
jgi:hypothetical protein